MESIRYYYADEQNQPVGPFGPADLEKMLVRQVLAPDTMVCPEGGMEWVMLGTLFLADPVTDQAERQPPLIAPSSRKPVQQVRQKKKGLIDTSIEGNLVRPLKMALVWLLALVLAILAFAAFAPLFGIDPDKLRGNGTKVIVVALTVVIYGLLRTGYCFMKGYRQGSGGDLDQRG